MAKQSCNKSKGATRGLTTGTGQEKLKNRPVFLPFIMPYDLEYRLEKEQPARFKSEGERRIATTLHEYGIRYEYEQPLGVREKAALRTVYPDFFLPEFNLYIEYYGRVGNQHYDLRTAKKQAAYAANNLNVISLYPWDLIHDWPNYLLDQLRTPLSETTRTRETSENKSVTNPTPRRPYHTNAQPYRLSQRRPYP